MTRPIHIIICCFLFLFVFTSDEGRSIKMMVSPHDNLTSINVAIEESSPGDIIEVFGGTYRENINLSKRLILKGISFNGDLPVLDAMGQEVAILITSNDAIVDGLIIVNSTEAGIKVTSNNNIIKNNKCYNNKNGIVVLQSTNNSLLYNKMENNKLNGIAISNSTNNEIVGNILDNNSNGIKLVFSYRNNLSQNLARFNKNNGIIAEYSANNSLLDNLAEGNLLYGISLINSINNTLRFNEMVGNRYDFNSRGMNNIDTSNFAGDKPIYYILNASGIKINASQNASTIYCINCFNVILEDQKLFNNGFGIYLDNTTNSIIQRNSLTNNNIGIYLLRSNNNTIFLENAIDNNYPIYAMFSFNNNISIDAFNSSKNRYPLFFDSISKKNNSIKYIGYHESPLTQIHAPRKNLDNISAMKS